MSAKLSGILYLIKKWKARNLPFLMNYKGRLFMDYSTTSLVIIFPALTMYNPCLIGISSLDAFARAE